MRQKLISNICSANLNVISGWVFFILLACAQSIMAQNSDWTLYNKYNHKLNVKRIWGLAIDSKGNKWIATDSGVVKFNGTVNVIYTKNSGLPNNFTTRVAVDKKDNIWVATFAGAVKFDGVKWSVFNSKNTGLPAHFNYVRAIAFDRDNNTWIGTDGGVAKFDGTNWTPYVKSAEGFPGGHISSLAIDPGGTKWIGTDSGLVKFDGNAWYRYTKGNSELPDDKINDIAVDKNGDKWIIGSGSLVKFDGSNWKLYNDPSIHNGAEKIAIDNKNNLWIGGYGRVVQFDGNVFVKYDSDNSKIPNTTIYGIAVDALGNKWIADYNGGLIKMNAVPIVVKRDTTGWTIFNKTNSGLTNDFVTDLAIDKSGNKWISSGYGLLKFDGNAAWTDMYHDPAIKLNDRIGALVADKGKNIWIGADPNELARYDGSAWIKFQTAASKISSIAIDYAGNRWLGTRGGGLVKIDDNSSVVYNKANNPIIPSDQVSAVAVDERGIKWIGTDNGLVKFDGQTWTVYKHDKRNEDNSIPGDNIFSLAIDAAGNKWIGTTDGIAKLAGTTWTVYRLENSGLPGNFVRVIAIDAASNKWIGTDDKGLAKFDGSNWTVYNKANSGLPDDEITSIVIDQNDAKWIGTRSGLAVFGGSNPLKDPVAMYNSTLLNKYVEEFGKSPRDNELRKKIIALAGRMKPAPAIPVAANEKFVMGVTFREQKDYVSSIAKLNEALVIAPWWADAYKELGLSLELAKKYDEAISAFESVLLSRPADAIARSVTNEIAIIKAKRENGAKERALGKWVGLWSKKPRSVVIEITKNENGEYKGIDSRGNTIDLEFKNDILRYQRLGYQYDLKISEDGKNMFGGCYKLTPYTAGDEEEFKKAGMKLEDIEYEISDNIRRKGFSLSYARPDDGEFSNTANFGFSGEWRDEQGNIVINITKTSNGFVGSISNDGVWVLNDPNGGKNSAGNFFRLDNFWTSGNTVHFVKTQYFRDAHKRTWGPITATANLTLSADGNTLRGTFTTTTNLGSSENPGVLYKRD